MYDFIGLVAIAFMWWSSGCVNDILSGSKTQTSESEFTESQIFSCLVMNDPQSFITCMIANYLGTTSNTQAQVNTLINSY